MLSTKLNDRFKELCTLTQGWDDDDAVPINTAVLQLARQAIECLLSQCDFQEPEIGAVEDGRLDLYWNYNNVNVFCTLDEDKVRIHACNDKKLRDLPLGDAKNRLQTLVAILRNELNNN